MKQQYDGNQREMKKLMRGFVWVIFGGFSAWAGLGPVGLGLGMMVYAGIQWLISDDDVAWIERVTPYGIGEELELKKTYRHGEVLLRIPLDAIENIHWKKLRRGGYRVMVATSRGLKETVGHWKEDQLQSILNEWKERRQKK